MRERRVALSSTFLQKLPHPNQDVLLLPVYSNSASSESPDTLECGHAIDSKPSSVAPLEHDHTYYRRPSKKKGKLSRQEIEPVMCFKSGNKVMLMHKGKSVGIGVVAEGHTLHGHAIPQGYVKVIIDYIQPNTAPLFASSFDDEESLTVGQFTAWPASDLNHVNTDVN